MAKWGEGDPRWIVEERPDATNVNNWHWTEKDATQWSKDKLNALFTNLEIEDTILSVTITEVSKFEGDAVVNNRKAKLIFIYDLNLELSWEGRCAGSDEVVKGKVEIPNLSEENDLDEIVIDVMLSDPTSGFVAEKIKAMMRSKGVDVIRDKLSDYLNALRADYSQGLILPTKGGNLNVTSTKGKTGLNKTSTYHPPKQDAGTSGVKINTTNLTMEEEFKCTAYELYRVFTVQDMVQAFSQGPAEIVAEIGGKILMLDTNVSGKFLTLNPPDRLEFSWRFKSWPAEHYSKVSMTLDQTNDSTKLKMIQEGVPEAELERTRAGWQRYYFDAIKRTFGFGAILSGGGF
ncbi:activator of 90 kDa heat shock protein ATPase homolog 1 [Galendromus occidentalis]|uniref:Activator of 90 kDa heat shock protein ATPase homolog 1 n=1 Tax=Galendromus occidentalis TaxID=34638 RepID=A0AAJ6QS08_9ACAR|nr:activator of 90 kDa heat shock protein ATPase homolog 1 [Galendromus occidentalis]